ncbi:MAG: Hsp70 family protein [Haliangiales bacterium]
MQPFIGIDFGTTNSAVGLAGPAGPPRLASFPVADGVSSTWRSVLYFEPVVNLGERGVSAGAPAIERYLVNEGEGRLILSIKSHLASRLFTRTRILGRTWTLETLIATFLEQLRRGAADAGGDDLGRRAVVGRPVRYWGAREPDDEQRALTRMQAALAEAGFDEVIFEYEPVAAAARYGAELDHDELVLIADFGGGTSDFSLVRIGPGTEVSDPSAILATGGVGIGGDTFDGRMVDAAVAPLLGKGGDYEVAMGGRAPVPAWLYGHLRRWHHLSFLKTRENLRLLDQIERGAADPDAIARFVHVIENDLGLPLHQSVESAKITLSGHERAELNLTHPPLTIDTAVERGDFEAWIAGELSRISAVIDDVLTRAGVNAGEVDRVFATGGSSFVPAVRHLLGERFGHDRLVGGEELTSVAWGLAIRARQCFG